MPRVKPITEYPASYFKAINTAYDNEEFVIECESYEEATALRAHLYTFRSVLRKSRDEYPEIAAKADNLSFQISGHKLILKIKTIFGQTQLEEALHNGE